MSTQPKKLHRIISPEVGDYNYKNQDYSSMYSIDDEERAVRKYSYLNKNSPLLKGAFSNVSAYL